MSFSCPFKNENICNQIPNVAYNEAWHEGGTGYIDGIQPDDEAFINGPLVKFKDDYGRSAIAIQYTVSCPETVSRYDKYAVTAFQRYSGETDLWVYGGHYAHFAATPIMPVSFPWLESLVLNNKEEFTINHLENTPELCVITLADANTYTDEL